MATDLARRFQDAGVAAIIYTDIDRDGAMQGPNIEATEALARAVTIPVIASGGVSRMADLLALRDTGVIAGAISGRALYDGAIDLARRCAGPLTPLIFSVRNILRGVSPAGLSGRGGQTAPLPQHRRQAARPYKTVGRAARSAPCSRPASSPASTWPMAAWSRA
jgi:hypothetical protein